MQELQISDIKTTAGSTFNITTSIVKIYQCLKLVRSFAGVSSWRQLHPGWVVSSPGNASVSPRSPFPSRDQAPPSAAATPQS